MSVPEQYTNAINALKSFRSKIFEDLVGGRIRAGLDASHDGMKKYSKVIDFLGVYPQLFGVVRQKALTLKFKSHSLGTGAIRDVSLNYIGGTALYPLKPPFSVTRRTLPQVDVFVYTPVSDMDLIDATNIETLKSFVLIQCTSDKFEDAPDAENAVRDYYEMIPCDKYRGEWGMSKLDPKFNTWTRLIGEWTLMRRELIKKGTMEHYKFWVAIWVDASAYEVDKFGEVGSIWINVYSEEGAPDIEFRIANQTIPKDAGGIWGAFKWEDAIRGFIQYCSVCEQTSATEIWKNHFKLKVEVNDEAMGYTDPPIGEYTYDALLAIDVTAYPKAGYKVDRWERDGVKVGTNDLYTITMYKDYTLKCFFVPA